MTDIGARLRTAREQSNLSLLQAAEKLHVDPNVIHALETEQFGDLGAAVYVRGHLRHYAELVRESAPELLATYAATVRTEPRPDLTQMPHATQSSSVRSALLMTGVVLAIGVGLIGSIHWIKPDPHPAAATAAAVVAAPTAAEAAASAPPTVAPASALATPVAAMASAPLPAPRVRTAKAARSAIAEASVTLKFNSACWTEVHDAHGAQLYRAIGAAGDIANLRGAAPLKVVIGNSAVVDIEVNGQAQGIPAQAQAGRTAEFLVTQAGELQPLRIVTAAGNKP